MTAERHIHDDRTGKLLTKLYTEILTTAFSEETGIERRMLVV